MKAILNKQIHGSFSAGSYKDVWLKKEIDLPFSPFIGLQIFDGNNLEAQVKEIVYRTDTQELTLYTEDDKEIYNAELNNQPHRPMEEIVKDWTDSGWEKEEISK